MSRSGARLDAPQKALVGWRDRWGPALLALTGGAAAALAHPPFGLLPGLFGYAAVLLALEAPAQRPWASAFRRGWAAGTGYLTVSTLWVAEPFLVDAATHAWQIPFALLFCGGGIGLLWGLGGLAFRALRPAGGGLAGPGPGPGPGAVTAFAATFAAAEWVRGHLFTGFPWDLPGETFRAGSALSQGAALVGVYGLTPLVLAIGAAPAALWSSERGRLATFAAATLLVGGLGGWGAWRLHAPPPLTALRVRVVQPDLPEPPAWTPEILARALGRYTALTARPAADGGAPDLVVWPEGALPATLNESLDPRGDVSPAIARSLRPGQRLVLGGARGEGPGSDARYFNALVALRRTSGGLSAEGVYDKHHLVPFGEYLPLRWLFDPVGFRKVLSVPYDFSPGPPPRPVRLGALTVQPLICYEALFPGLSAAGRGARADVLVNISDDAWFGRWMGPWQHLNLASHRAIEEGLPMLRATPTGVSAIIDAFGRPSGGLLAPGREGVVDALLPGPAGATPYSRLRDLPFLLLEAAAAFVCLWLRRERQALSRSSVE